MVHITVVVRGLIRPIYRESLPGQQYPHDVTISISSGNRHLHGGLCPGQPGRGALGGSHRLGGVQRAALGGTQWRAAGSACRNRPLWQCLAVSSSTCDDLPLALRHGTAQSGACVAWSCHSAQPRAGDCDHSVRSRSIGADGSSTIRRAGDGELQLNASGLPRLNVGCGACNELRKRRTRLSRPTLGGAGRRFMRDSRRTRRWYLRLEACST